jgi:Raf kinase inhibitor-like YbhB/YbcL family protein
MMDSVKMLLRGIAGYGVLCANLFASEGLRLTSPVWHEGGNVPLENVYDRSGCNGANLSPEISWSGAPSDTKSFAITIFDVDAPKAGGWAHWVMFNIPANVSKLEAGAGTDGSKRMPSGASECVNDYGTPGYGGPCPPPGARHRYVMSLYALKVKTLPFNQDASSANVAKHIVANAITVARMTVKFGR